MNMIDYLQAAQVTIDRFKSCQQRLQKYQQDVYQHSSNVIYPMIAQLGNNQLLVWCLFMIKGTPRARSLGYATKSSFGLSCKRVMSSEKYPLVDTVIRLKYIDRILFIRSQSIAPHVFVNTTTIGPSHFLVGPQRVDTSPPLKKRIRKTKEELREALKNRELKETKNIPKNFSKAIITYCQKNRDFCEKQIGPDIDYEEFLNKLQTEKKQICNIQQFTRLLTDEVTDEKQRIFNSVFRRIGAHFLKKHAVGYIFHSRIVQINWHLKYRVNMLKAMKNPQRFKQIKYIF